MNAIFMQFTPKSKLKALPKLKKKALLTQNDNEYRIQIERSTICNGGIVLRINSSVILWLGSMRYPIFKIIVARPGLEPRTPCFASQQLNHPITAAPPSATEVSLWILHNILVYLYFSEVPAKCECLKSRHLFRWQYPPWMADFIQGKHSSLRENIVPNHKCRKKKRADSTDFKRLDLWIIFGDHIPTGRQVLQF